MGGLQLIEVPLYKCSGLIAKYPQTSLITSARHAEQKGKTVLDPFSSKQNNVTKIFSFIDYLTDCIKGERAFNSNSIVLKRESFQGMLFFPDGRANRSGDLYLWVRLMHKVGSALWSSHIGSMSFRDVIGVSKTQVPSMIINRELVKELSGTISTAETKLLKKYANRLIRTAYFEQKKIKGKAEMGLLKAFYWRNDLAFCTFWFTLSLLPTRLLSVFQNLKTRLKERIK